MAERVSFAQHYATYAGKTLGDYALEQQAEQLENGLVFQARHIKTNGRYRLRFLALPAGLTPEERLVYLGHFQREAGQVETLKHPTILPLIDYGIYEGAPYLVAPDLPLHSLHALLSSHGPLDLARASHYLDQMASALEYAHQQGILHLNLNARTTFLKADSQLVVADFGLLRMLSPQGQSLAPGEEAQLENGAPLLKDARGRPLYGLSLASAPAPELLLGQPVDNRADIYALGALIYQLLTGHRVLRAENLSALAQQHLKSMPPSLSKWRQNVPAELDRLLGTAMAREQNQRFRSAGAFANAYAQLAAPNPKRQVFALAAPPPAPPAPVQEPPASPLKRSNMILTRPATRGRAGISRRRAIALIAAGGGIAVATAAVAGFLITSNPGSRPASIANTGGQAPTRAPAGPGNTPTSHGKVLAIASHVPANSATTFPIANSPNPGVLINLGNNRFVAFNSTCTHAGCEVKYNSGDHLLECPCHGASFDPAKNAEVVSGPAPAPLTSIPITVNANGTITENS